jgi:hypothetical protein
MARGDFSRPNDDVNLAIAKKDKEDARSAGQTADTFGCCVFRSRIRASLTDSSNWPQELYMQATRDASSQTTCHAHKTIRSYLICNIGYHTGR